MNVIIACESSGTVREAFRARGHNAISVDLLDTEIPGQHHQGDVVEFLYNNPRWDLMIAHPTCTYMCNSGVRWLYGGKGTVKDPDRWEAMRDAAAFFNFFQNFDIGRIAVENPIPHRYAQVIIGPYTQVVQPWWFGHEEQKATCLWLKNLPPLEPTNVVGPPPKDPEKRKAWAKVHRASPGPDRWRERSRTLTGLAAAMASQWGGLGPL